MKRLKQFLSLALQIAIFVALSWAMLKGGEWVARGRYVVVTDGKNYYVSHEALIPWISRYVYKDTPYTNYSSAYDACVKREQWEKLYEALEEKSQSWKRVTK